MKFVPRRLQRTADGSRGKARWQDWAKGLTSVALVVWLVYLLLGVAADSVAEQISEETEVRWFKWVDLGDQPLEDPRFARAQRVFDALCRDVAFLYFGMSLGVVCGLSGCVSFVVCVFVMFRLAVWWSGV